MAKSELDRIADQMAGKRMEATKVIFGLARFGDEERAKRAHCWWRCRALDWIETVRALAPPNDWAFVNKLDGHLQGAAKKEKEAIDYSDREKRAWRSFVAWHSEVWRHMEQLVELLKEHAADPFDLLLQQRLVDRGCEIKERYRSWLESNRIVWMPMHLVRNERGGRAPCNVIDYTADALTAYEQQPPYAYTPAAFETYAKSLRKELNDVREKFLGVRS